MLMEKIMNDKNTKPVILKVEGITKYFGSVRALSDVSFEVYEDEVVGLVGDNGAGKSTLIKIISGNFPPDKGNIYLEGQRINFKTPVEARRIGIETVYQDLSLCENLDASSNLFIGRELHKNVLGFRVLQKREMEKRTVEVLGKIGINIPSVKEKVEYLSGGQRQAVALGRFVAWGEKLILLDEPTAALGVRETRKALDLVLTIRKEKSISMIFISHNLQHVFEVADRIIVLRHGEVVGIRERKLTNPDEIVALITGAIFVT
jgi:ABC-type sugar transport system ATPase subunit